jgi:lipopolysaccharide/colanic/teichoic acid biosynthesis glycosyltransferase
VLKRLFDLVFAIFWLTVTAPLILVIAVLIKLDSPGPALYVPQMVGRDCRPFRLFRFRTMRVGSPAHLSANERLTRVGRFIRNYSLDHLPTLFNILKGDLSIVGPRPMEPEVVDLQDPAWQAYFRVKPGFFNYAVLKLGSTFGPSSADNLALKRELELEYIQKQSLVFDLQLLFTFIRAHIASGGNVKARGKPDPKVADRQSRPGGLE